MISVAAPGHHPLGSRGFHRSDRRGSRAMVFAPTIANQRSNMPRRQVGVHFRRYVAPGESGSSGRLSQTRSIALRRLRNRATQRKVVPGPRRGMRFVPASSPTGRCRRRSRSVPGAHPSGALRKADESDRMVPGRALDSCGGRARGGGVLAPQSRAAYFVVRPGRPGAVSIRPRSRASHVTSLR